jgi:hypothetical protein
MDSSRDMTLGKDAPENGTKKRWNTPRLTEFGQVVEANQSRNALGSVN